MPQLAQNCTSLLSVVQPQFAHLRACAFASVDAVLSDAADFGVAVSFAAAAALSATNEATLAAVLWTKLEAADPAEAKNVSGILSQIRHPATPSANVK